MKRIKLFLAALTALVLMAVPAFAVENPSTGDNSVVAIALVVMGVAAIAIAAVLLMGGKGKKKKKKRKNTPDQF